MPSARFSQTEAMPGKDWMPTLPRRDGNKEFVNTATAQYSKYAKELMTSAIRKTSILYNGLLNMQIWSIDFFS